MRRVLLAALSFAFGVGLIVFGLWLRADARAGLDWPTARARVLDKRAQPMRQTLAYPVVRYTYEVNGTRYESDRYYARSNVGQSPEAVERLLATLPDELVVHYDPAAPGTAFIRATPAWTYWLLVAAGGVALLLGVIRLLPALHALQRART